MSEAEAGGRGGGRSVARQQPEDRDKRANGERRIEPEAHILQLRAEGAAAGPKPKLENMLLPLVTLGPLTPACARLKGGRRLVTAAVFVGYKRRPPASASDIYLLLARKDGLGAAASGLRPAAASSFRASLAPRPLTLRRPRSRLFVNGPWLDALGPPARWAAPSARLSGRGGALSPTGERRPNGC